jgi:CRISPR-associated protein (TIGR03986 family)
MSNRQILNLPKHKNPSSDRTASAPYNFVPLPEVVVTAVDDANDLPDHDRYYPDRHTGYFEVTLTTKSPLYVRCPFTRAEFDLTRYADRIKNTPHFFYTRDRNLPVIPGSSLRGMLRSVLEIVSYGKMRWVTEKNLFFRTVDDTAVGRHYRRRMTGRVEAGFLRLTADGYVIRVCHMARVPRNKLSGHFYEGQEPNKTPRWDGQPCQWIPVWVRLSNNGKFVEEIRYEHQTGWREGRLVITGDVPGKRKEFVFLLPADNPEEISVPGDVIERFHDDDQITQWQERAFPKDKPEPNCRDRNGTLRRNLGDAQNTHVGSASDRNGTLRRNPPEPGDPVFFLRENGQLTFFGRAQMFRLPYTNRPIDLVPPDLRRPEDVDYAEALFGFVRTREELEAMKRRDVISEIPKQGDKRRVYAGRVFVTDAVLEEGQTDYWLSDESITPKILATPKPTAFQHYLTQQEPDDKNRLDHYDSPPPHETVIRGHKRYWHQGLSTDEGLTLDQIRERIEDERARLRELETSTQHTQFRPVKPGVRFKFRIHFENLSERELGALCWMLQPLGDPEKTYCHHLGMGKPLGMGAVNLGATLYLTNRPTRYSALFDGDNWKTGTTGTGESLSDRATLKRRKQAFEQHILEVLGLTTTCQHLFQVKRIGMLLKLMEWPGYPADPNGDRFLMAQNRPNTRYMTIQPNEYRDRPVLPDPCAFDPSICNLAEPASGSPGAPAGASTQCHSTSSPPPPSGAIPRKPGGKAQKRKLEQAKTTTKREWVTLIEDVKGKKVRVQTEDGEIVMCTNFPPYPKGTAGTRCRADVTREGGKAKSAIFKGWGRYA